MEQRINGYTAAPKALKALYGLGIYLAQSSIEQHLLNLLYFRVSQINGCAYCLDMHAKDLRLKGESEQRLYMLSAWREAPVYTNRERAALAWAEAITTLGTDHVGDEVYQWVRTEFSEEEIIDLTMAVITINSYNRINIAFRTTAGTYEPGQFTAAH